MVTLPKKPRKELIPSPVEISYSKIKNEERKILEFDPSRIKAGEAVIFRVDKWGGLANQCFAVMNVGGKNLIIKQLREEEK